MNDSSTLEADAVLPESAHREDPALFVEKRFGFGYTVNFGNPWAWVIAGVLLVLPFAMRWLTSSAI